MNVIVGPDGCGKSAFLEAVLWSLWSVGHPDTPHDGDEVIFEGTKDRAPASACVVELFITSRLPTFEDMQVRRVAFRGADHEVHVINQLAVEEYLSHQRLLAGQSLGSVPAPSLWGQFPHRNIYYC